MNARIGILRCVRCRRLKGERGDFCNTCLRQLTQGFDVGEITAAARYVSQGEIVTVPTDIEEDEPEDECPEL